METAAPIELLLASGDRLRIPSHAPTLKMVQGGAAGTSVIHFLPVIIAVIRGPGQKSSGDQGVRPGKQFGR
jgi:hypothetical protein